MWYIFKTKVWVRMISNDAMIAPKKIFLSTATSFHLGNSGVGAVGANDEVKLIVLLDAFLGAFRVARVVDFVLTAVLVRGYIDRGHERVDRRSTLETEMKWKR